MESKINAIEMQMGMLITQNNTIIADNKTMIDKRSYVKIKFYFLLQSFLFNFKFHSLEVA